MSEIHITESLVERFYKLLGTGTKQPNGCILWPRYLNNKGYGQMGIGHERKVYVHRVSYSIFVGPIPIGLNVCHRCDTPNCINPVHFFLGTQQQNIADCVAKGRFIGNRTNHIKGSDHKSAKLTEDDIIEIRRLVAVGTPQMEVVKKFSIAQSNVSLIVSRKTWKHVV